ncbi:hypothetical protein ACFVWG_20095 [Kribbella sp. NPDC058245]|uniref:hypothetical protein n=1 Tax=Kribbella sp. NPDC058245 TaxID=3346399 RepID=UPI0036EAF670
MTDSSPRIGRLFDEYRDSGAAAVDEFWQEVTASGTPAFQTAGVVTSEAPQYVVGVFSDVVIWAGTTRLVRTGRRSRWPALTVECGERM